MNNKQDIVKKIVMGALILLFASFASCKQTSGKKDDDKPKPDPAITTFKIEIKTVANGKIVCTRNDGSAITNLNAVPKDTKLVFVLTPNAGYVAKKLIVDGAEYTTLEANGSIKKEITLSKNIEVSGECAISSDPDEELLKEIKTLLETEMVAVPVPANGLECTLGYDDNGNDVEHQSLVFGGDVKTFFVHKPFSIAKHEVSYKLFYNVRVLAEKKGYKFANKGLAGSNKGDWDDGNKIYANEGKEPTETTKNLPVTMISYNDLVVWCNALSELMGKEPVYYKEATFNTVLKDAGERAVDATYVLKGAALDCHNAKAKYSADGYRLPRMKEWEMAAKWQGREDKGNSKNITSGANTYYYTKGDSFSGASANFRDEEACKKVAWYKKNSENKVHAIGEKTDGANALGLFDMSGNVAEFTANRHAGGHTLKGGSYSSSADDCITTYQVEAKPEDRWDSVGFRLCCGVQGEVTLNAIPTDIDAMLNFPTFTSPIKVPMGIDDSEDESIKASFKIGKYEVCNKLFYEVLDWASKNNYTFAYEKKTIATEDEAKPVTNLTWYDAIVWCNAYSEKKGLTPCYYDKTKTNILKSSKEDKWVEILATKVKEGSTGYRLPNMPEWVAVARLKENNVNAVQGKSFTSTDGKTYYFTRGNFIAGASFNYDDEIERDLYSINLYNSEGSPAHIGSKKPNFLGAFDMSGNVWEWCFDHEGDENESIACSMGGGFIGGKFYLLSVGNANPSDIFSDPKDKRKDIGFRVVQNQ